MKMNTALAGWLRWLERHPVHNKVVGSVPSWGVHGRRPTNVSLSVSLSLSPPSFFSKITKYILGWGLKKRKENWIKMSTCPLCQLKLRKNWISFSAKLQVFPFHKKVLVSLPVSSLSLKHMSCNSKIKWKQCWFKTQEVRTFFVALLYICFLYVNRPCGTKSRCFKVHTKTTFLIQSISISCLFFN